jgi:molecular chaperone DnaK
MQRVREAAEKAKIELSDVKQTDINLPFIAQDDDGDSKNLEMTINRSKLEELVSPLMDKLKGPVDDAVDSAGMTKGDVDKVIMVGGPSRMPIVQEFIKDYIGTEPERGIDPMECVSEGAAIQAGVLSGDVKDVLLLDVTPLSLGIETEGGVFTKLIEKNTTIPTKQTKTFSTAQDNQRAVTIRVFQGERAMAEDNKLLGEFDLVGIPPAPRGVPKIEVTFDIDADGIVNVSAKDQGTGKEQSIRITAPQKLDEDEIERMKEEAEQHAEEDEKKKERIQKLNKAQSFVHSTRQMIDEMGDQMDESTKDEIEAGLEEIEALVEDEDAEAAEEKMEEVNDTVQEFSSKMYQQAQGQAGQGMDMEQMKQQMGDMGAQMGGQGPDADDFTEAEEVDDKE